MNRSLHSGVVALVAAFLFLLLAIAALLTAYSYSRSSGLFPIFVGWIFLALTLFEVGLHLKHISRGETPAAAAPDGAAASAVIRVVRNELGGFLWLGLLLVVLYVTGFLIAIPVFMFAFLRFAARRSILQSALIAFAATAFAYGVFAWLLDYQLYAGILFDG